jgi:hypothetical protein
MAEYKHQEQDFRAGLQHLANLKQEASATPVVLIHQHQVALAAVQDLDRQQVAGLIQHQAGVQHQYQQHQ